jgi:RNA polymerase sigma factor (TIGR02999 family)
MKQLTPPLTAAAAADPGAASQLLPLVYDELRRLATQRLQSERAGQTLQATALVHEAYVRLVEGHPLADWNGRGHFFAAAAEAMRRILIDRARRKQRPKHGGHLRRVDLDESARLSPMPCEDLLALDEALSAFAAVEPVKAQLVKLRFFAGMTIPEAAQVLEISEATAQRYWTFARAWLYCALEDGAGTGGAPDGSAENARPREGTGDVCSH